MKLISVSGGRSSMMMLKIMLDNGQVDAKTVVIFANTGKESEATLKFIQECETRWSVPIKWIEYIPEKPGFKVVNYDTAARQGQPFAAYLSTQTMLPNPVKRLCTIYLKIKLIRKYIRSLGHRGEIPTYLGIRFDEPLRVAKKKASNAAGKEPEYYYMPLHEMRITKKERDEFWKQQPFDLQISSHHDNCDLCFMKGKWQLIWQIRENPSAAEWWIEQEKRVVPRNKRKFKYRRFNKEFSYSELLHVATTQTYIPLPENTHFSTSCECGD